MTGHTPRKRKFSSRPLLPIAILILATPMALAQSTATPDPTATQLHTAPLPEFAVAAIKLNKTGTSVNGVMSGGYMFTPSGLDVTNMTLSLLIHLAYGIEDNQIVGAPGWATSERYDIAAKVDTSDTDALKKLTFEQRNQMMQPLLADRFKLRSHYETRELPIYTLVVIKSGSKMKEKQPDTSSGGTKNTGQWSFGNGDFRGSGITMDAWSHLLTQSLERTVVDKTGLTGKYDFTLKWTSDDGHSQTDTSGPSIFTAIQEQLGLKLEAGKGPVQVLVIDHIERPTEN